MATPAITTVEFDQTLLVQLREGSPGKTDRELLEALAINQLGDAALAEIRAAFADVPEEEIEREAVKATREARHEMAAERNAPEQAA